MCANVEKSEIVILNYDVMMRSSWRNTSTAETSLSRR